MILQIYLFSLKIFFVNRVFLLIVHIKFKFEDGACSKIGLAQFRIGLLLWVLDTFHLKPMCQLSLHFSEKKVGVNSVETPVST